jgi:peptidoglycan-associated lipoprotein
MLLEEMKMSGRFYAVLGILIVALMAWGGGCGPKPEPVVEEPPVVEPEEPVEEPVTEPVIEPEPEVIRLTEDQFKVAYFDFDKYNLRSDARAALEFNARLLKDHANVKVLIEGHCDERGTVEYNLALGERRARASMDYLVSLGVDRSRLEIISYGKERPVALGHNEESWAKNRRAEFTITEQ